MPNDKVMPNDKEILVIGASHMDIVAQYGSGEGHSDSYLDKEGKVYFSWGGTGLIIAYRMATLPERKYEIQFLTTINPDISIGKSLLKIFEKFKINHIYCIEDSSIKEGRFVGIYNENEKKIESAVTQTSLETNDTNNALREKITGRINEAIRNETYVVIADCNLPPNHLCDISNKCLDKKTLLFLEGVSEHKCKRLIKLTRRPHYERPDNSHNFIISIFSCNMDEFISLVNYARGENILQNECADLLIAFNVNENSLSKECIIEVCQKLFVKCFLIHDNNIGYYFLHKDGDFHICKLHKPKGKGVGDAIIAGAAHYYFNEIKDMNMNKRNSFKPVIEQMNIFIDAATEDILSKIERDLSITVDINITEMVLKDFQAVTASSTKSIKRVFVIYIMLANAACIYLVMTHSLPAIVFFGVFIFSGIMMASLSDLKLPEPLIALIGKIPKI